MMLSMLLVSVFTFVELNCENLFDVQHDSLKQDQEFLPESSYHWTPGRYWRKLNRVGQEIVACGEKDKTWALPDMVALCEVENDSVLRDLTRRSLLRKANYEYVMTHSPDVRGIDVALLYSPLSFALIRSYAIRIEPMKDMRPTRDILYASGLTLSGDTLHVFVLHAPSRGGGEKATRPFRERVALRLCQAVDSIRALSPQAPILVAGDFNDYTGDRNLEIYARHGLTDVSAQAVGSHGAKGTYRYHGRWDSLDHIFVSAPLVSAFMECGVFDEPFLLKDDEKYGGVQPSRNYLGPKYLNGFSDHLPLVLRFRQSEE